MLNLDKLKPNLIGNRLGLIGTYNKYEYNQI